MRYWGRGVVGFVLDLVGCGYGYGVGRRYFIVDGCDAE